MKCPRLLVPIVILSLLTPSLSVPAFAGKLRIKKCSAAEKASIRHAHAWLKKNVRNIDRQMGRNGLMDWPGKSRKKFIKKLNKRLKVVCINDRMKCRKARKNGTILMGRTVPILHQRRVALCANSFTSQADYVSTLAHEIGHLIRLNVHRTNCVKRYRHPRFAQSLGLAAFHAYNGVDYNAADYIRYCP